MAVKKQKDQNEQPVVELNEEDVVIQNLDSSQENISTAQPEKGELQRQQEILMREQQEAERKMAAAGSPRDIAKRKKLVKRILAISVVVVIIGAIAFNYIINMLKGPPPVYVETQAASKGNLDQLLSTTGTITSGERIVITSPVSAPLAAVKAELGSVVDKDSMLFVYDTTPLERSYHEASAGASLNSLKEQEAINESNKSAQEMADAQAKINSYSAQETNADARIEQLKKDVRDVTDKITTHSGILEALNKELLTPGITAEKKKDLKEKIEKRKEIIKERQTTLDYFNTQLEKAQKESQEGAAQQSTYEAKRDAAEKAVLNDNQRRQLSLQGVSPSLLLESVSNDLQKGQAGLAAPITGVITSLEAVKGAMAAQYTPLCTIESLEKVDVIIQLSRFDLERVSEGQTAVIKTLGNTYEGVLTQIDSMVTRGADATGSSTGFINATISINNPDSALRLGIEANVDLTTARVKGVVMVPLNAVNTDVEGTYCFVMKDGKAERRTITTGISSDTNIEVTEGISEGDEVILSSQNIFDGAIVTTDEAFAPKATMMNAMMGG